MPDQKMVYESMEEMSNSFKKASQQLQEMNTAMGQASGKMEGGALKGKGGELFASALKETLKQKIDAISSAMMDLSAYVLAAMSEMKSVEQQDTKMFKG